MGGAIPGAPAGRRRLHRLVCATALCLAAAFSPGPAGASVEEQGGEERAHAQEEVVEEPGAPDGVVDRAQEYVGDVVEALARYFDGFFGGELAYEEATGSHLQVGGEALWEDDGTWDFDDRVFLRLVLPHTQKRFRLVIESQRDALAEEPGPPGKQPASLTPSESRRTLLGLEGLLQQTRRWRVSLTGGVKFPFPPDPFTRLRGRWQTPLGSWNFRFAQSFFWFLSDGLGEATSVDFERRLSEPLLLRLSSQATYIWDDNNFDLLQALAVFHRLSARDALTYRYALQGETHPATRIANHVVSVKYRRKLYRDWLFFEVEPGLRYTREDDFERIAFVAFRLDALASGD